jgi:hypothetical protein
VDPDLLHIYLLLLAETCLYLLHRVEGLAHLPQLVAAASSEAAATTPWAKAEVPQLMVAEEALILVWLLLDALQDLPRCCQHQLFLSHLQHFLCSLHKDPPPLQPLVEATLWLWH